MNFRSIISFVIILSCLTYSFGQGSITNFTINDGLSQNNVTTILFDAYDYLWVGTNGGLCVYDGKSFYKIKHSALYPRITQLVMDKGKKIYIGDDNLNFFNSYNSLGQKPDKTSLINDFKIVPLKKSTDLDRIVTHSLELRSKKTPSIDDLLINYEITHEIHKYNFYKIGNMLLNLDPKGTVKSYTVSDQVKILSTNLHKNIVDNDLIFQSGSDLYGLFNNTIHKLMVRNDSLVSIKLYSNVYLNKVQNKISRGEFDPYNGNFIFGSHSNGLYIFKPTHFNVLKIGDEKKLKDKNHSIFYSHAELENGNILVNGSILFDTSKKYKVLNYDYRNMRSLVYRDKANHIWYSDRNKIINQHSASDTIIFDFELTGTVNMISIDETTNLISDANKLLLLKKDKITELIDVMDSDKIERFNYLFKSQIDSTINILTKKNICRFNINDYSLDTLDNLPECDYRIMSSLSDKYTFVGTYGQGFFIYDGKKWYPMPLDKKGHLKFAHAALVDAHGHIWISTNNGLFRTRLQDMTDYLTGKSKNIFYYYYDKSSGFLTNEFNGGCQSPAIKLKDGRFSFSSMDGLVQFDPLKVPALFPNNPLQIVHLSLNGQSQDSIPPLLEITQDIKDIKLEISTAYYGHTDNLVIQYKIPGYVESWTDLTDQRYITLQNAHHGSFNIEIRKRSGFGDDNFDYVNYPVTIKPYFYQTWWFMVCVGLGLILIIIIAARWYSRKLASQKVKLEKMVQDRNQSLIDINISLEDKIKQNEMFHSVMVHDIKAPLFFMGTISDEILKGLDHLSKDDIRNNISSVKQAANHLNNFIINFLTWVKSKNDNLSLQRKMVNLADLMQELKTFYSHTDKIMKGRLSIVIECDDDITVQANRQLLMIVLGNLLSNSIKFSTQGTITLYAYLNDEGGTVIGCKDQGKGMSSEMIALLTSSQYKGNAIREDSFRMGYVFINDIIKMMTATLFINSIPGEGSDVSINMRR